MQNILKSRITTAVLLALAAIFAIHVVAQFADNARLDLTEDDLYSLSEGTHALLDKMQAEGVKPIEITLYFSETAGKTLPKFVKDFITYERYLEALLEQYAASSDGKIRVRYVDPVPDSDDAQDALDLGLDGKPINQDGDLFFFGLAFETQTGSRDKIEFLWPNQQETVEYEIAKRLSKLLWPTSQRIGVLSSLPVVSDDSNPYMAQILAAQGKDPGRTWLSFEVLGEQYQVERIDPQTDRIDPEQFDLVAVVHPKSLGQRALWALDEWVTRGGNTLVFVDPYAIDDQAPQNPQQPFAQMQYQPSSNLATLMDAWGVERQENAIAADFDLAVLRPVSRRGAAERVIIDLAIDPEVRGETLDTSHPILQGIDNLRLFLAGKLDVSSPAEGLTVTPLITTTANGGTLDIEPGFPSDGKLVFLDLNSPGKMRDAFVPGTEPVVIAALLQGKFPSAFPDGVVVPASPPPPPPPGWPPGMPAPQDSGGETVRKEPVPEAERGEASVLVVADVDLISDQVAFQQTPIGAMAANDNHKVLLNAVDYLFGSEEMMKVRAKKPIQRPFTLFDEIEARADAKNLEKEREIRAEIEHAEEQLRDKQGSIGERNAALFQKQLQDEIDSLNARIREREAELREIRKGRREALEAEERRVRVATLGVTPALVLLLGLGLFVRRRKRDREARRTA